MLIEIYNYGIIFLITCLICSRIHQIGSFTMQLNKQCRVWWLTHWGRVMHICISKLTIIGSDNGLSPGQCQAIIWTNAWILLNGSLGATFSEISSEINIFSFKKMHLKMSSGNWQPSCLSLNVLITLNIATRVTKHKISYWNSTSFLLYEVTVIFQSILRTIDAILINLVKITTLFNTSRSQHWLTL